MNKQKLGFIILLFFPLALLAQQSEEISTGGKAKLDSIYPEERISLHFQTTLVDMVHKGFHSPYQGLNSQPSKEPWRLSVTSTLFAGVRIWKGGEIYINPELNGGRGIGQTLGIAGFPNGETYRIGEPEPVVTMSRIFIRQTFGLSKEKANVSSDKNIIKGSTALERLVITFGKFSITDMFDNNTYSHDPRTQFCNWAIMSAGAWDYPANTRGYTYGLAAELIRKNWALRMATVMVPEFANGPFMDLAISKAHSETIEFDHFYKMNSKVGALRFIVYNTYAHMGSYKAAIAKNPSQPDITATRTYNRTKTGFVVNGEQELSKELGAFGRISYNDGKNETWAFTEIDQSFNWGLSLKGNRWKRASDVFGLAFLLNGISKDHRNYLELGGYGFIIGDGQLNYGHEGIAELYYSAKIFETLWVTPGYQFVLNPAYNRDRGPIHIFSIRAHVEF
ncbi:MAG: hypothetical protein NVS9B7_17320 [Flavisolibacter sp.]